jgi:hypothetical protein
MTNEENLQESIPNDAEETPIEAPASIEEGTLASTEAEGQAVLDDEIDLNQVFPEEETDLNQLFPDLEMKTLLKKVQKNKKDLNTMRDRFSEGI